MPKGAGVLDVVLNKAAPGTVGGAASGASQYVPGTPAAPALIPVGFAVGKDY